MFIYTRVRLPFLPPCKLIIRFGDEYSVRSDDRWCCRMWTTIKHLFSLIDLLVWKNKQLNCTKTSLSRKQRRHDHTCVLIISSSMQSRIRSDSQVCYRMPESRLCFWYPTSAPVGLIFLPLFWSPSHSRVEFSSQVKQVGVDYFRFAWHGRNQNLCYCHTCGPCNGKKGFLIAPTPRARPSLEAERASS